MMKLIIFIIFSVGGFYIYKGSLIQNTSIKKTEQNLSKNSETLKKYLLSNQKPARVEIISLTQRFEGEVNELKKLKIAQDKNSAFYVSIQFFTDESDSKAPLIAQIRFIETKTGNTIKEESLNLD